MSTRSESVLITGGGIIGLATAHYLTDAGYQVTIIDRADIGGACSFANCGFVCPSHILPLNTPETLRSGLASLFNPKATFRVKLQSRFALYQWFAQFARRCTHRRMLRAGHALLPLLESSLAEYRQLFATGGLDAEWKENGLLYVFETEKGLARYAKTDRLLTAEYDEAARRIEGNELSAFDSSLKDNLAGAFLYEEDGSLRPDKLIIEWRDQLMSRGVKMVEHCRLEGIDRANGKVTSAWTTQGEFVADHYVFATGAWSSELAEVVGARLPVEPGKGYSVTMSRPENCPTHPMLFLEHGIGVTPFDEGYRLGSMMEFVGFDTSIPEYRIDQLQAAARPYLRTPVGDQQHETWFGWRPMTWDSLPIIGRVPGLNNGLLATGHNMLGLTLAPATGRLVAELVQEQSPHLDMTGFSPSRF
ncbi:MAG: NAD(P)/FAD-dependent oxidoreductase [Woeseiaceae bacterium]